MKFVVLVPILLVAAVIVAKVRHDAKQGRVEILSRLSGETGVDGAVSPTEALFREAGVPVSDEMRQGLVGAPPPPTTSPLQSAIGVLNRVRATPAGEPGIPAPEVAAFTPAAFTPAAFAPPVAPSAPATSAAAPPPATEHRTDLSDLFAGIEMPCDLIPLAMVGAPGVNCAVATFTTDTDRRPELASALGTELARIGCEVTWVDHATALARRADGSAVVRIYDRPGDLTGPDGGPAHPEVGTDRILVSLTAT